MKMSTTSKRITNINAKQDLLMKSLSTYFKKNKKNLNKMIKIIDGKSTISLRIIDWFITNYSKKYNISIKNQTKTSKQTITLFNVHHNYKTLLAPFHLLHQLPL